MSWILFTASLKAAVLIQSAEVSDQTFHDVLKRQTHISWVEQQQKLPESLIDQILLWRKSDKLSDKKNISEAFLRYDWPVQTLGIFAENQLQLIDRAETLKARESEISFFASRSERFRSLVSRELSKTLTPFEAQAVANTPYVNWPVDPFTDDFIVLVDSEPVDSSNVKLSYGVHRISFLSNKYGKQTYIVTVDDDFSLAPKKLAVAKGSCFAPQLSQLMDRLTFSPMVVYSRECLLARSRGIWTEMTTRSMFHPKKKKHKSLQFWPLALSALIGLVTGVLLPL